jgi:hypothetical protein
MENNDKLPRRNIFIVPDNYFDSMESEIRKKISKPEKSLYAFFFSTRFRLAMVASVVVFAIMFFLLPNETPADPEALLAGVSDEELSRYLEENTLPESDDILYFNEYNEEDILTIELNSINDSIL